MKLMTMLRLVDLYDLAPKVIELINEEADKRSAAKSLEHKQKLEHVSNRYDKQLQKRYMNWSV